MADIKATIEKMADAKLENKEFVEPAPLPAAPTKAKIEEIVGLLQERDKNGGTAGIAQTTGVHPFHIKAIFAEMNMERGRREAAVAEPVAEPVAKK